MDFKEYQDRSGEMAVYPGRGSVLGLYYVGLGLGEAGEVQGKIKKVMRDDDGNLTSEKTKEISKELGDSLWYIAQTATELGLSLDDIAAGNLEKLEDRKNRGVLKGSGDNR